jgi:hypothetical protein
MVCAVRWCLDAAGPHGVCPLHARYPLLYGNEERDRYFARLRDEQHVGAAVRKARRTPDVLPASLIGDDVPAEPGVAQPGLVSGGRFWMVDPEG